MKIKEFDTKNKKFKATFRLKGPFITVGIATEKLEVGDLVALNPEHGWVVKAKMKEVK